MLDPTMELMVWPELLLSSSVMDVRLGPNGVSTGASLTDVEVTEIWVGLPTMATPSLASTVNTVVWLLPDGTILSAGSNTSCRIAACAAAPILVWLENERVY